MVPVVVAGGGGMVAFATLQELHLAQLPQPCSPHRTLQIPATYAPLGSRVLWGADKVVAGTACFVVGSDGPFSHAVFGVGDDLVDAHNNAAYHVKFSSTYTADLLLNPPANE
jgi:hypothetical protein